jgi:hypothetical protein
MRLVDEIVIMTDTAQGRGGALLRRSLSKQIAIEYCTQSIRGNAVSLASIATESAIQAVNERDMRLTASAAQSARMRDSATWPIPCCFLRRMKRRSWRTWISPSMAT